MQQHRFSLAEFLCRRAKRLSLPSGICLLVLCIWLYFSGRCYAGVLFDDITAASLHYVNLYFMQGQMGYFVSKVETSIVLHYWSLAVEEQLYLVIPLIMMAYRFVSMANFDKYLVPFLVALSGGSLVLIFLEHDAIKFFFIAARFWEFCVGALVSYFDNAWNAREHKTTLGPFYVCCVIGLVLLGVWTPNNSYPNLFVLPVVALTAFIISCRFDYQFPVVETVGNMSYSIYLYHWPIIQLMKYYASYGALGMPVWVASVGLTAVFSIASYRLVEIPVGELRLKKTHVLAIFIITTVLPALLAGSCSLNSLANQNPNGAQFEFELADNLNRIYFNEPSFPWLANNDTNLKDHATVELLQNLERVSWPFFDSKGWGTPWSYHVKRSTRSVILLVGDSHAMQWFDAVSRYAEALGVSLMLGVHTSFEPLSEWLPALPMVVSREVASYSERLVFLGGRSHLSLSQASFDKHFNFWSQLGCTILIGDSPFFVKDPMVCLKTQPPSQCAEPMAQALHGKDLTYYHHRIAHDERLKNETATINVNDLVCWNKTCKTNIYNLPVYFDGSHFSQLFIHFAAPLWLQRARRTSCACRFEAALLTANSTS
jgi:peptidoglycan/LPS O-acetylase OafA/YrhL